MQQPVTTPFDHARPSADVGRSPHATTVFRPSEFLPKAFAAFGAVVGLFAIFAIGGFREPAREVLPLVPAVVTAIVGAIAGAVLGRWQSGQGADANPPTEVVLVRVGATCIAAGAASSGIIGFATWGVDGVARFAAGGAALSLVFLPGCYAVYQGAVRAARARRGSLVAASDRRTMLATLLSGAAFAAATPIPALLKGALSTRVAPPVQAALSLLVCAIAAGGILLLERRNERDRLALEEAGKNEAWLETVAEPRGFAHDAVDLGLGHEHHSKQLGGYRAQSDEVQLRGSLAEARAAFAECARSRHLSFVVAASSLAATLVAIAIRLEVLR